MKRWHIRGGWKNKSHRRASERMQKCLNGTRDEDFQEIRDFQERRVDKQCHIEPRCPVR